MKAKSSSARGSRAKKSGGARPAAAKATRTFSGKRYKKNTCSATKTAATATAKKVRSKGKAARVVKTKVGYCVYTRG